MIATLTLNPSVDESTSAEHVVPERKLRLSEPVRDPGGGGLNVARAARELGADVLAFWTRGGRTGELLGDLLAAAALPEVAIPIRETTRRNLIVLETSSGLQYRFGPPGPALSEAELSAAVEAVRRLDPPPRFLVASGSLPPGVDPGFYARVADAAAPETRVVVDTSGEALRRALGRRVFLVKPNLRELATLTGKDLDDDAAIVEAACGLVERGAAEVVLASVGAGGAVLAWSGGCERIHAPTVPIRSKVGAGDSTVGGFVAALDRGLPVPQAARYGVAAGSAAVMTPGTALCRRADVERLFLELTAAERSSR